MLSHRELKLRYWLFRLRWWWARLYVRKNEFHWTLNFDLNSALYLTAEEYVEYQKDLIRRRWKAYENSL